MLDISTDIKMHIFIINVPFISVINELVTIQIILLIILRFLVKFMVSLFFEIINESNDRLPYFELAL